MIVSDIDNHILIRWTRNNLAYFLQSLAGNNNLLAVIVIFHLDISDRYSVSVKRNNSKLILLNLKKLTCHQFIVVIVSNWENCLSDNLFKGKLWEDNRLISLNIWYVRKIITWFSDDIELGLFTWYDGLEGSICLNCYIIVRKLSHYFWKNLGVKSDNSSLSVYYCFDSKLHIVSHKLNLVCGCINKYALENCHCSTCRYCLRYDINTFQ